MVFSKYYLILIQNNKKFYCTYHTDDGSNKLVFCDEADLDLNKETFNIKDLNKIDFHLNNYGYEVEEITHPPYRNVEKFKYFKKNHELFIQHILSNITIPLNL